MSLFDQPAPDEANILAAAQYLYSKEARTPFLTLYEHYEPLLLEHLSRLLGDGGQELARDLTDEVFFRVWRRLRSQRPLKMLPDMPFGVFLAAIARRVALDHWRSLGNLAGNAGSRTVSLGWLAEFRPEQLPVAKPLLATTDEEAMFARTTALLTAQTRDSADVRAFLDAAEVGEADAASSSVQSLDQDGPPHSLWALAQLSERQRDCLILSGVFQLTYAEIGAILSITEGTVGWYISHGRERLRRVLARRWTLAGLTVRDIANRLRLSDELDKSGSVVLSREDKVRRYVSRRPQQGK